MALIEENRSFSKEILKQVNDYFYKPLVQNVLQGFIEPLKNHLTFSSLKKIIIGNPNEAHSRMLDDGIKSYTVRLSLNANNPKIFEGLTDLLKSVLIGYQVASKNELYFLLSNCNYVFLNNNNTTEKQLTNNFILFFIPLYVMIVIEMNIYKTDSMIYLMIGVFRSVHMILMGRLLTYLPVLMDYFYLDNVPDANLCTYDDNFYKNSMNYLKAVTLMIMVGTEIVFQVFKYAVIKNYNLKNSSSLFMEQFFIKIVYAGSLFWFGYYNYGFSILSMFLSSIMIVPYKFPPVIKLFMISIFSIPIILFIKELGVYYLIELVTKAARAQACLGRYDFYGYLWGCIMPFVYFYVYSLWLIIKGK